MESAEIRKDRLISLLPPEIAELRVYEETDSTSTQARRYASDGGTAPALFVADSQTSGRGRTGKTFYSPRGTGLYASLLLPARAQSTVYMTTAAAVAVRRAIERITGISTDIKWVNDLYLNGKKIAGILCESLFVGSVGYVIIGFGVNLSTEEFPDELSDTAASLGLRSDEHLRDSLAAACVDELLDVWKSGLTSSVLDEYKKHSAVLGKEIRYCENQVWREGIAESIDIEGRLGVRLKDGSEAWLSSGEITVRLI